MRARNTAVLTAILTLLFAAAASAHIERASYWPDPAPDTSVRPATGGAFPKARSLASALAKGQKTNVVCQSDSMSRLKASIASAVKNGYDIRPYDHRKFSAAQGKKLLALNQKLFKRCKFREIQPAVTASGNNGRVVVMPGLYTEPTSRKAKTGDPKCAKYKVLNDRGNPQGISYEGQFRCPNDQNLIAVIGRGLGKGQDPAQPRPDRRGIPNLGPCIRCNLQLEGSGVSADDVIVDAGRVASGNKGPIDAVKDVGLRVDRADGFVMRNMTFRHAREHGVYVLESDGFLFDRFKSFYNGEYGVLTFVEDHGMIQNCEAAGNGDSGLYPGAAAETGQQGVKEGWVSKPRYNQVIRLCDSHHNASGYSGTDGNAVRLTRNNLYDNALGYTTDVFTASGHPGFPSDSGLIDHNNFFNNNFNPYVEGSDVKPTVPVPVGTGMWIAGGNNFIIRDNNFYDNWRRGTMLFAVPDALVCTRKDDNNLRGCDPSKVQTSFDNRYFNNTMGVTPDGKTLINGTDFWWDAFTGNTGNCWYDNKAAPGRQITESPSNLPDCAGGKNPSSSIGTGSSNESELLGCAGAVETDSYDPSKCPWFETPPKPSGS